MNSEELIALDLKQVKNKFGDLFYDIEKVLRKHNPIPYMNFAEDEYEPEAKTITAQCMDINSIEAMHELVYQEFVRWFDIDIAGSKEKYLPIAKEIFELIRQSKLK